VVKSDDSIWFTDPPFGILSDYGGVKAEAELPTNVYRLDPHSGEAEVVAGDIANPNGLCFSPDERRLYIVESGSTPRCIRVYDVEDGRRLVNGRIFVDGGEHGAPDGFRCDVDGNLWAGWGTGPQLNGVMVFAPDGAAIGRVALPERCANLCFGGIARNRLFMAAGQSLYALYVDARGAVTL
jgi:gluconolactonase